MDFTPSEAGTDLAALTKDILAGSVSQQRLREVERAADRIDRGLWAELATAGVLEAALPAGVGGGFGLLEQCAVLIELGRAVAPVPYLESIAVAAAALARFGDESQRARWAVPAAAGELILTVALAEEYCEDPTTPTTVAERVGAGWRLTGAKASVPWAPVADAILVPARTATGTAVFVVTPDDPGVTITPVDLVDLGSAGWLDLDDVSLPADRLVGTTDSPAQPPAQAADRAADQPTDNQPARTTALRDGAPDRLVQTTDSLTRSAASAADRRADQPADADNRPADATERPGVADRLAETTDSPVRAAARVADRAADQLADVHNQLADATERPHGVADRLVGAGDVVDYLVTAATVGRCAWQVGVLEQALALTAEHARTRVQFDRPIAAFQAVTQRLADAYIDVEAVRLTLWQAAWRVSAGLPSRAEVATAKFWAADAGHRVAHTAVHIHGGMGIDTDHPLHRYFIAAKRTEFELGSATTQLRRLGALLADEPA